MIPTHKRSSAFYATHTQVGGVILLDDWLRKDRAGLPLTQVGHKVTDFTSQKLEENSKDVPFQLSKQ